MKNLPCRAFVIVAGVLFAGLFLGCSKQAKAERHLAEAAKYYQAGEYDKAEVEYKNAMQAAPEDAEAIGQLGIIYFDQGRIGQSIAFLRRAIELDPEFVEARAKLGMLQLGTGRPDEAREAAEWVLNRKPDHRDAPVLLAESSMNLDKVNAAKTLLEQLPPAQNDSAPVLTGLAVLEMRRGQAAPAQTLLERAIERDAKFAPAHAALARVHLTQRRQAEAEAALQRAAELSPVRSPSRVQYAQFLQQTGKAESARKVLEEIEKKAPDFIPAPILLADMDFNEKKFDAAMPRLERVLARYPSSPEALILAGRTRLARGEVDKALTVLQTAVNQYPQAPQMHYYLGTAHAAANDLANATGSFGQAISLAPKYVPPAIALAEVELRQGNNVQAITSLQKILADNPKLGEAYMLLAQAHRAQGNLEEALRIYRELDKEQTQNPIPSYFAGSILAQQGKRTEARQAFTRAVTLAPNYLPGMEQLVNLDLQDKQWASARERIEGTISQNPNVAGLRVIRARVALAEKDFAAAEAALHKAIELDPNLAGAHAQLAQVYIAQGQEAKAMANLSAALAKNPRDVGVGMTLAALQEKQRDFAAARESYEKVVAANPNFGVAYNNLAYLYAEYLQQPEKAMAAAQRARDLMPDNPYVLDTFGWVLYHQRQFARALPLLQNAANQLPELADVHFHLGMATYMLGDENGATASLEKALQLDPDFSGHEQAKRRLEFLRLDPKDPKAAARIDEALAQDKSDSIAWARAAKKHEADGKFGEALAAYEAILKSAPNHPGALLGVIRMHEAKNDVAKAFDLAKNARRTLTSNPQLEHLVGRLAYKSGEYTWSANVLQEAARRDGANPDVQFDLADAALAAGQVDEAAAALRKGLALAPKHARAEVAEHDLALLTWVHSPKGSAPAAAASGGEGTLAEMYTRAVMQAQRAELPAARSSFDALLQKYPDFAPAQKGLASIYLREGQNDAKAAELAGKVRQRFPRDAEATKLLGMASLKQKNASRAVTLLEESARARPEDAEVQLYLGLAQAQNKQAAPAKRALERALELGGLSESEAAEAKKALAAL